MKIVSVTKVQASEHVSPLWREEETNKYFQS